MAYIHTVKHRNSILTTAFVWQFNIETNCALEKMTIEDDKDNIYKRQKIKNIIKKLMKKYKK